jgi:hypothetical protein
VTDRRIVVFVSSLAAIVIAIAIGMHLLGRDRPAPLWQSTQQAWKIAKRVNPEPGYLYNLSTDCRTTVRVTTILDRPMIPVGIPVKSWVPVTVDTNSGNGCHHASANEVGVYFAVRDPGNEVMPIDTNGAWVFSHLGPDQALAAHLIPTLPLTTWEHPMGDPGNLYLLNANCTSVQSVVPVKNRPGILKTAYQQNGGVESTMELALTNGTFQKGKCGPIVGDGIAAAALDGSQLRWTGQWVYSTLGSKLAFAAHLIPALPVS